MRFSVRLPLWLPLAFLGLLAIGTLALAQPPGGFRGPPRDGVPQPGMPQPAGRPDGMVETWECTKCKHVWNKGTETSPTKCPSCGTRFDYIESQDGTKTKTEQGKSRETGKLIGGIVVLVLFAGLGIYRLIAWLGRDKAPVRRKKKLRPRDDDDDDDDDDDRPVKKRRPRDDLA